MGVGLSGMVSGLDTDAIVKAMVEGQKTKQTKIENKITTNKWTTEAWSGLNKKIYSFYTDFASKLRLQSSYSSKSAKSSKESAVSVTASTTAAMGTHTLKIKQLASSQYVTGAKLKGADGKATSYTTKTLLKNIDPSMVGDTITVTTGAGTADEKTSEIKIDEKTTVQDFTQALKDAGLSASFDAGQQRFFISAKESGKDNAFTITSKTNNSDYRSAVNNLTAGINPDTLSSEDKAVVDAAVKNLTVNKDLIDEAMAFDSDAYDAENATDDEKAVKAVYDTIQSLKDIQDKQAKESVDVLTDDDMKAIMVSKGESLDGLTEEEVADAITAAREAEITNRQNTAELQLYSNLQTLNNVSTDQVAGSLKSLGLGNGIDGAAHKETEIGDGEAVVVAAANSEIVLDGATMEQSSNSFTVAGISLNLTGTTEGDEEVQLTVGKDVDSVYKLVKDALKSYNELVDEMSTLYYAKSARDYKPLTEDQKKEMSEDEIKNWEDKIKASLLRRDDSLGGLMSAMRTALGSSYKDADGKEYSLSAFGIVTGNYTEYGKLHIYGDPDDSVYAANNDKLKKAIEEDPEKVTEVFSNIFTNLYKTMSDKCAKTEISSALTFYNDKQMTNTLGDYEDDLKKMKDKIKELEDRYYKQFTTMETALSKLTAQTSQLQSMLGTGTGQ